eukprot:scaffold550572_cov17-Prasinocladus_malaysianus.AAC.2
MTRYGDTTARMKDTILVLTASTPDLSRCHPLKWQASHSTPRVAQNAIIVTIRTSDRQTDHITSSQRMSVGRDAKW